MAKRVEMSGATKKGIALAIGALCVCVVGAVLAVGRGSGSTGLQATRDTAGLDAAGGLDRRSAGSDPSGRSGGPLGPADHGGFDRFRACLVEQGVQLPERGARPAQPDEDLRAAFAACRRYLPEPPFGADGGRGPGPGSGTVPPSRGSGGPAATEGTI